MNTVAIDTLKTVQKLQAKGFTAEQAEGIVDALTESELVTKTDLRDSETRLKNWGLWLALGQIGVFTTILALMFQTYA